MPFETFAFSRRQIKTYYTCAQNDFARIARYKDDPEASFRFGYDALIKLAMTVCAHEGKRVLSRMGHHIELINELSVILQDESIEKHGNDMRKIRNKDMYSGGALISRKDALYYAEFVKRIFIMAENYLNRKTGQLKLFPLFLFVMLAFLPIPGLAANSGPFSVSVWVQPTGSIASKAIVAKAEEIRVATDASGHPLCQIRSSSSWQTAAVSSAAIPVGRWLHIACAYDLANLKIYVNGEEKGSTALSVVPDDTANVIRLGRDLSASTPYGWFAGLADDLKFYNYSVNIDEIKIDYNSGAAAVLGSVSTARSATSSARAASAAYCVPGSTDYCAPPVGEWKLDERVSGDSKTLYDTSGNGNNATTVDGANNTGMDCTKNGKLGLGCEFDGVDDYVDITPSGLPTESRTISLWAKAISLNGTYKGVAGYGNQNNGEAFALQIDTSNQWVVTGWGAINTVSGGDVNSGLWTHVVGIYSEGSASIYINGALMGGPSVISSNPSLNYSSIGARLDGGNDYFKGQIDHVRIYNYARTPAQIAWEYNGGKPIAEWRFNECQGSAIHDDSGNGNHGTLSLGSSGITQAGACASSSNSFWYNGRNGQVNSSGSFDGTDDWVGFGDIGTFDDSTQLSGCAWVYHGSLSGDDGIFSEAQGSGYFALFRDDVGSGYGRSDIYKISIRESAGTEISIEGAQNSSKLQSWTHVCFTFIPNNSSGLRLYINGKEDNYSPASTLSVLDANSDTNPFNIGINYNGSSYFDGQIDEVKIFNYALTAEQVKTEYNGGAVRFK